VLVTILSYFILVLIPSTRTLPQFFAIDIAFAAFSTIEAILRIVSQGFVGHRHAYLRSAWNVFDFFVVVTTWLSFIVGGPFFRFTTLRALRLLMPFRVLSGIRVCSQP